MFSKQNTPSIHQFGNSIQGKKKSYWGFFSGPLISHKHARAIYSSTPCSLNIYTFLPLNTSLAI